MKRHPCWRCFLKLLRNRIATLLPRGWMRTGYRRIHFYRCAEWATRTGWL